MAKPVVKYRRECGVIRVGFGMMIVPINHGNHVEGQMVSNNKHAITSKVEWYDEASGVFETLNTRYEPF